MSRVCGSNEGFLRQRRGRGGKNGRWMVAGSNRKNSPRGQHRGGMRGDGGGGAERADSRPPWKRGGRGRRGRRGRGGRNGGRGKVCYMYVLCSRDGDL